MRKDIPALPKLVMILTSVIISAKRGTAQYHSLPHSMIASSVAFHIQNGRQMTALIRRRSGCINSLLQITQRQKCGIYEKLEQGRTTWQKARIHPSLNSVTTGLLRNPRSPISTTGRCIHSATTAVDEFSTTSNINKSTSSNSQMSPLTAASRLGLDPYLNRFHAPIVNHERYSFPGWPETHTFPMDKFERLAHALTTNCKASQPEWSTLPRPLVRSSLDFFQPLDFHDAISSGWIQQPTGPIDASYFHEFLSGQLSEEDARIIGFREHVSRPELIERTVLEVAGTVLAVQLAFRYGIASNVAGGTHHARPDAGAGYTILNDLAVAANYATDEKLNGGSVEGVKRVLVVDCDVHQGDGTAHFEDLGGSGRLFTLSMHCESNYPLRKAKSTYDVGLPDGCNDEEYMIALRDIVGKAFKDVKPDLVLYDAGVDVYEGDKLGRLNISENGIRQRDRWVLDQCVTKGIPVVAVVGGGYDRDVDALSYTKNVLMFGESTNYGSLDV
uniref:Histone deacetylase domain-containing protein n=1 Tax=Ditylum brightwellii TaxID=49249 RepID=A0A7S4WJV2_9STRA